jgi:UDP-glucose 4-epimerase
MSTVLVTGAGGYIGSTLLGALRGDGWDVRALVREPVPYLAVEQTVADLSRNSAPGDAYAGVETVVHLAGENEVLASQEPASALSATVLATARLVEAAAAAGIRRLVYMSTVHVYGEHMTAGALLTEDLSPEPRSAYAISRLASEHLAATLGSAGADVVVLRLTNSVGPPADPRVDRWTLVANDLCRQGALSGQLELRSSGLQWRDFIALEDVCRIVGTACRNGESAVPPGTYNVGSGVAMTVLELAGLVQDAFERCAGTRPPLHAPPPGGEPPAPYRVSVERAARRGLQAETPVEQAVEETARFCIEHREALPG